MTVYSAFCLKGHKANVCKRKHQCNDCNSVLTIGGTKDKKNNQDSHNGKPQLFKQIKILPALFD